MKEYWIIEVWHEHEYPATNTPLPKRVCTYHNCPGEGWQPMSEAFFNPTSPGLVERERRDMKPRPLEVCIEKCYSRSEFFDIWSATKGVPYRLRNAKTGEIIPLAALGL